MKARAILLITALSVCAASARPHPSPYETVIGEDWTNYRDTEDLRARVRFFSFEKTRRVSDYVALVPDPTFGQVLRITQPATTGYGYSPELRRRFPEPLDNVWYRWRMKYSPGWTTVGPTPRGHNNAYKVAFVLWANGVSGRIDLVWANTDKYLFGMYQHGVPTSEVHLAQSGWYGSRQTTEWQGKDWWEFVIHFERLDPTHARVRFWRRQLTRNNRPLEAPFDFDGWEYTARSGSFAPAGGIALGVNKNKGPVKDQYIYWGPWEVVDGDRYPNPFNLPNVR